jgi:amidase
VSIPLHRDGMHVWNAIAVEGATALMVAGNSMGTNWKGHYTTSLLDFYGRSRRVRANDLSETVKLVVLLGQYMQDNYQGRYYAKAQNLARVLRAADDEALRGVDLLLMPTLPLKATLLAPADASREDYVARALEMISNTCLLDVTGHPAATFRQALPRSSGGLEDEETDPRRIDERRSIPSNRMFLICVFCYTDLAGTVK